MMVNPLIIATEIVNWLHQHKTDWHICYNEDTLNHTAVIGCFVGTPSHSILIIFVDKTILRIMGKEWPLDNWKTILTEIIEKL